MGYGTHVSGLMSKRVLYILSVALKGSFSFFFRDSRRPTLSRILAEVQERCAVGLPSVGFLSGSFKLPPRIFVDPPNVTF